MLYLITRPHDIPRIEEHAEELRETMWLHTNCGGVIESELAYSDAEQDYYFPRCEKCGESPVIADMMAQARIKG